MPTPSRPSCPRMRALKRRFGNAAALLGESTFTRFFARCAGILLFLAIAVSTETLLVFHSQEGESSRHAAAVTSASDLRARLDRELNAVFYLSSGLESYLVVRHNRLNPDEVHDILAALHSHGRHIRNFGIAIGYRLTYVYPLKGNEKAIGLDYTRVPEQWPSVKLAIASARGTMVGPVNLVQGGTAFIYRSPIFIQGKYWGLLSTVIDFDSFFRSAFDGIDQQQHEFSVSDKGIDGISDKVIWGNPKLFSDKSAVLLEMETPNGRWVIAARPRTLSSPPVLERGFRLMGWILAVLIGMATHSLLRQRAELTRHAGFDKLTGLPNRRLLDDRLEQAIRHRTRYEDNHIGLLFIDLDGFKALNDRYGHRAGDIALQTAALRIRDEVRLSDTVARWGGDEFVAIIEEANHALLEQLVERLRQRLSTPFEADGIQMQLAASIGSVLHPDDGETPALLLEQADRRMYADKQQGKRGPNPKNDTPA